MRLMTAMRSAAFGKRVPISTSTGSTQSLSRACCLNLLSTLACCGGAYCAPVYTVVICVPSEFCNGVPLQSLTLFRVRLTNRPGRAAGMCRAMAATLLRVLAAMRVIMYPMLEHMCELEVWRCDFGFSRHCKTPPSPVSICFAWLCRHNVHM